ncbi:MAG TPA: phospholipase C, phosphocholine-specific [Polyangiales bacterium]|nr:phospholipase C, phosphocholine-specific [Polyangiales bacterium]
MPRDTPPVDPGRRLFLAAAAKAAAAAISSTLLPGCVERALAIPAARVKGTIVDVQHVVILMQENRSFDHYFGTMAGVRGFGDRWPIPLPSGEPVWRQSDGDREILPFHLDTQNTTAMRMPGTPHSWIDSQCAWDQGRTGFWPKFKQFQSMGYYEETDIPFQRALAGAFTICDAHHCSIQSGTLPNRVVAMTGTNVRPGTEKPATTEEYAVTSNANNRGAQFGPYDWTTYPERLEAAGVRWRVYRDPADSWDGVLASWESFAQYQRASSQSPLCQKAMQDHSLQLLRDDVKWATLPQVSWIVPPPVWSEHPAESSPLQGASFTQQVLDILVSNPEIWSKTVFIISFDENDGLFDHMPPPAVPSYRADGTLAGKSTLRLPHGRLYHDSEIDGVRALRPYGLGTRVPMYVVSPWTKGGWVNSQVFDHTSTIRFLEARFGVAEPNISAWHRSISGDLTSCFNFAEPDAAMPSLPDMSYAVGKKLVLEGELVAVPSPQRTPVQASGMRYSRALPYTLHAHVQHCSDTDEVELNFESAGTAGVVFHVYDRLHLDRVPRRYTVEAGKGLSDRWSTADDSGRYELQAFGPNGFSRQFAGVVASRLKNDHTFALPEVQLEYDPEQDSLALLASNAGDQACVLLLKMHVYSDESSSIELPARCVGVEHSWSVQPHANWYDFSVSVDALPGWSRRFAGRLENGRDGFSDPALGDHVPISSQ